MRNEHLSRKILTINYKADDVEALVMVVVTESFSHAHSLQCLCSEYNM